MKERRPDKVTWPNGDRYPFEFHHVEGIEESSVVSTDQGNEKSKKNKKEVDRVVSEHIHGLVVCSTNSVVELRIRNRCTEIASLILCFIFRKT